jgi:hypothetical protein
VIGLVLNDAARQLCQRHFEGSGLQVEGLDDDLLRPSNLPVEFRQAQTAFLALFAAFATDNFRINEDVFFIGRLRIAGHVDHEDPVRKRNLVCRQANSLGLVHKLKHLAHGRAQASVDLAHRFRFPAQRGMWIVDDFHEAFGMQNEAANGRDAAL